MINFEEILDKLNIRYYKANKEATTERDYFLCLHNLEEDLELPFDLIYNKNSKVLSMYHHNSIHFDINYKAKILEILNESNSKRAFGTSYIDSKNRIQVYAGASLEGEPTTISEGQLLDYVRSIFYTHFELTKILLENGLSNNDSSSNEAKNVG